jgi:hypothetical protein
LPLSGLKTTCQHKIKRALYPQESTPGIWFCLIPARTVPKVAFFVYSSRFFNLIVSFLVGGTAAQPLFEIESETLRLVSGETKLTSPGLHEKMVTTDSMQG